MNIQSEIQQAVSLHQRGRLAEAAQRYVALLKRRPKDAGLLHLFGLLRYQTGDYAPAREMIERAIDIDAGHAVMHFNLGKVLTDMGHAKLACDSYRKAALLDPESSAPYANLAKNLNAQLQYRDAIDAGLTALARNPKDIVAHQALASAYRHTAETESARAHLRQAHAISGKFEFLVKEALLTPPMNDSVADIEAVREKFFDDLERLSVSGGRVGHPPTDIGMTTFYTSYHGLCNRDQAMKLAHVFLKACPELDFVAEHCRNYSGPKARIKVGFISAYMHHHSIGKTTRGIIAHLDRDQFEVVAIFIAPFVDDDISRFIKEHSDASVVVPLQLQGARKAIEELKLDILFFQDIGMEPFSYFLAYSRLAPVQCVSFGHPDTTGIPNMDWFVSSDLYEIESAQEHYSERLFLLEQCPTLAYYYKPQLPAQPAGREQFGLPAGKNIYLCPQTLFKLHPDFDPIVAAILRSDPNGCLVIIEGVVKEWVARFLERMRKLDAEIVNRVIVLPFVPTAMFTALVASADLMLDTIHFNGMNTSLEAFSVGTPVVTMPTDLQRGRHTAGMYAAMGMHDVVAVTPEDYVRIAVELGTDRSKRDALSRRILEANNCLFQNPQVVREFERFFRVAIEQT